MPKSVARRFLQSFDYFGVQFNFHYKSKEKYRSATGGIIMIGFVVLAITYVMINVFAFVRRKNFSIIYYTTRLSQTDEINFRNYSSNYAFGIQCGDDEIQKRVYKMFSVDINHVTMIKKEGVTTKEKMKINLRHCLYSDFFNEFNETFDSLGLETFWCPNEQNYTVQGIYSDDAFKYYEISIASGADSSDNYDDIQNTLINNECDFNMYFVDVAVDLYDYKRPIKRFMNTNFVALKADEYVKMNLDFNLQKFDSYENYLFDTHETKYYIGYAYFEQYSIFKGIERYKQQPNEYDRFAKIYLRSALQRNIISRKYMKLTEFAADMSSILSQILLFLFVSVSIINRFYASQSVMKKIFQFKNTKNKQGDAFMDGIKKYRNLNHRVTLENLNNTSNDISLSSVDSAHKDNKTNEEKSNNNMNTSSHAFVQRSVIPVGKSNIANSTLFNISSDAQSILNKKKRTQVTQKDQYNQRKLTNLFYDNEFKSNNVFSIQKHKNAYVSSLIKNINKKSNDCLTPTPQPTTNINTNLDEENLNTIAPHHSTNFTKKIATYINFNVGTTETNLKPNLSSNSIIRRRTLKQKEKKEIMLTYSIIELLFVFICPCLSWEKLRLKNILLNKGRKKLYFQLDILTFLKNMQLLELLNYVMLEKHENLILKILSKPSISLVNIIDIYEQLHMKYNVDISDKEMKEFYLCMRYLADKNNKTNQEERLFKIASVEMQNLLNEE